MSATIFHARFYSKVLICGCFSLVSHRWLRSHECDHFCYACFYSKTLICRYFLLVNYWWLCIFTAGNFHKSQKCRIVQRAHPLIFFHYPINKAHSLTFSSTIFLTNKISLTKVRRNPHTSMTTRGLSVKYNVLTNNIYDE